VLALALAALAGGGCGSAGSGADDAATSRATTTDETPGSTTSDPGGQEKLTVQEQGVKFAECMRASGVPHFPDPDPKGEFAFGVDVTPEVWTKAVEACKALKPPGALSAKRTQAEQSAGVRFAQCMRRQGVKDFPDPVNGEPLINTYKIPSSNQPGGMEILDAAIEACGQIMEESAGGQG
jgi:hypothetical protein